METLKNEIKIFALLIPVISAIICGCSGSGGSSAVPCLKTSGCITLSWDPPTKTDSATGTTTTETNIGYKLHWGTQSGSYDQHRDVGAVTIYQLRGLADGTYYFVVSAYRLNDTTIESANSNEVTTGLASPAVSAEFSIVIKRKE
ncbi:MAG: fibronectin type III domain-containing protein [Bdellovibrio sp.]